MVDNPAAMETMRVGLKEVAAKLQSERDPMEIAADWVERVAREGRA